jgi:hypothetical protein
MPVFPSVNPVAVVVAPVIAFLVGGLYWVLVGPRLDRALGGTGSPEPMPAPALAVAFASRYVLAFGMAVVVGWAIATTAGGGVVVGVLCGIAFALTIVAGQTAFGRGTWREYATLTPQLLIEYGLMAAILAAWR